MLDFERRAINPGRSYCGSSSVISNHGEFNLNEDVLVGFHSGIVVEKTGWNFEQSASVRDRCGAALDSALANRIGCKTMPDRREASEESAPRKS